jgi:hypothetical protein
MCLGEMSYCLGKIFSKCSLHLVKNYNAMQKVTHSILHWLPISFFKKNKTSAMQACLEEDINVWGSKCVGQVRGNVNAKENALKGPNH